MPYCTGSKTLSITTFSITALSIMTLDAYAKCVAISSNTVLNVVMLNVVMLNAGNSYWRGRLSIIDLLNSFIKRKKKHQCDKAAFLS